MGWMADPEIDPHGTHEGYFAGLVPLEDGEYVEQTYWNTQHVMELPPEQREFPLFTIQVACTCGWHSQRMLAPAGTTWFPYVVCFKDGETDEWATTVGIGLWRPHVEALPRATTVGYALTDFWWRDFASKIAANKVASRSGE